MIGLLQLCILVLASLLHRTSSLQISSNPLSLHQRCNNNNKSNNRQPLYLSAQSNNDKPSWQVCTHACLRNSFAHPNVINHHSTLHPPPPRSLAWGSHISQWILQWKPPRFEMVGTIAYSKNESWIQLAQSSFEESTTVARQYILYSHGIWGKYNSEYNPVGCSMYSMYRRVSYWYLHWPANIANVTSRRFFDTTSSIVNK